MSDIAGKLRRLACWCVLVCACAALVLLGLWGGLLLALLRFYAEPPLFRWGFAASLQ